MLEANLELLRAVDPEACLTVVSADPTFTAKEMAVEAVARLGFDRCTTDEARQALLNAVSIAVPCAMPAAFERLAAPSDGLIISGGGNLASAWPNYIFERLAFCRRAARVGARIIFLGQTLGPTLDAQHREMVSEMLGMASWVGVREEHSFALALELGVSADRLSYQLDDAAMLGLGSGASADSPLLFPAQEPWIALTLHPIADPRGDDPLWDQLALQLTRVADETGCRLVFIPHAKANPSVGAPWSDEEVGEALARRMSPNTFCTVPVLPAREVAALTGRARMIISSRYHPIVFGLTAGVPCLGIWTDDYTRVKLQGALNHYGRADDTCSIEEARGGGMAAAAMACWAQAEATRQVLRAMLQGHVAEEEVRWGQLRDLIAGKELRSIEQPRRLASGLAFVHRQSERSRADAERRAAHIACGLEQLTASMRVATAYASSLERARAEADLYTRSLEKELSEEKPTVLNGKHLTDADWEAFRRDGFLHLGQVLNPLEVSALQGRADALALGILVNPAVQMQLDTGGKYEDLPGAVSSLAQEGTHYYRKIQGLEMDDLFMPVIQRPLFKEICAEMYGRHAGVSIFRAMIMNKPAGRGTDLPWHQDGGTVWQLDRDPLVTIWVALDSATAENGCMDAVPGSHKLGLLDVGQSVVSEADALAHCTADKVVALEVPSGHAVLLHNWLIHRSGLNSTPAPRRAFTMCCMDARTRSILTGNGFPLAYGAPALELDPYVQYLQDERDSYRQAAHESERYALSLVARCEELDRSIASATLYATDLETRLSAQRNGELDLDDLRVENRRLHASVAQLQDELVLSSKRVAEIAGFRSPSPDLLRIELEQWRTIARQLEPQVSDLAAQVLHLQHRLDATYASRSWRVTQPLRRLSDMRRSPQATG